MPLGCHHVIVHGVPPSIRYHLPHEWSARLDWRRLSHLSLAVINIAEVFYGLIALRLVDELMRGRVLGRVVMVCCSHTRLTFVSATQVIPVLTAFGRDRLFQHRGSWCKAVGVFIWSRGILPRSVSLASRSTRAYVGLTGYLFTVDSWRRRRMLCPAALRCRESPLKAICPLGCLVA